MTFNYDVQVKANLTDEALKKFILKVIDAEKAENWERIEREREAEKVEFAEENALFYEKQKELGEIRHAEKLEAKAKEREALKAEIKAELLKEIEEKKPLNRLVELSKSGDNEGFEAEISRLVQIFNDANIKSVERCKQDS